MVNMNTQPDNKEVSRFLQKIGVDTRFVSIIGTSIHVNNQRFSKFSNNRQETFIRNFPNFSITRSKIFQRICTRASRVLANSLKPKEKILILESDKCSSFILDVILEPYTRKYGIKIVHANDLEYAIKSGADSIALPLTLDNEVESILGNILTGEKIEVYSLKNRFGAADNIKYIYPLLNVPRSWIVSWLEKLEYEFKYQSENSVTIDLIKFFESFIPDVRENILKSAFYVVRECDYKK